jgi:monoamine oxidase
LFGSEAVKTVKATAVTRWNAMPYMQGAVSGASPGGQFARRIIAEPQGNVHFAGEATHETQFGTVDGAWQSGERAAEAALKTLAPVKPEPAAKSAREKKPPRRERAPAQSGPQWPR